MHEGEWSGREVHKDCTLYKLCVKERDPCKITGHR